MGSHYYYVIRILLRSGTSYVLGPRVDFLGVGAAAHGPTMYMVGNGEPFTPVH
jgi:hypothetical protein